MTLVDNLARRRWPRCQWGHNLKVEIWTKGEKLC
jgi:hypothetical protein